MFADKEIDIVEWLQEVQNNEICLLPETDESIKIFETIHDKNLWLNWTNSSGKSDPPPDFYSDKYHLMMDVMRVDDHAYKNKKGKVVNPHVMHEKELYKELSHSGILNNFNPDIKVFINGDTGLSTIEDHNYTFYCRNFNRIIKKHIDSIPLYLENHPDYKVVFMIFDESTAYIQSEKDIDKKIEFRKGNIICGQPHICFVDRRFLNSFINTGIDYLIWYAPYKRVNLLEKSFELPKVCAFDLSKEIPHITDYIENKMISSEI